MRRSVRLFGILLLFCLLLSACSDGVETKPSLEIRFLDVGQGDCTLVRTSAGDILIDAGPESAQDLLCIRLRELGVTELALAIFSHPDEDHLGGADGVLRSVKVREVWINGEEETHETMTAFRSALEESGATLRTVQSGDFTTLGDLRILVMAPITANDLLSGNEGSVVIKLYYGNISAFFTGDAEEKTESKLMEYYDRTILKSDLYKVGHHGSSTSSGERFIQAVEPRYAVICCGRDNTYGHPHGAVLSRLESVGAEVLRTDIEGEIVFISDGVTLERSS